MTYEEIKQKHLVGAKEMQSKKEKLLRQIGLKEILLEEVKSQQAAMWDYFGGDKATKVAELQSQERAINDSITQLRKDIETMHTENTQTKAEVVDNIFKNW